MNKTKLHLEKVRDVGNADSNHSLPYNLDKETGGESEGCISYQKGKVYKKERCIYKSLDKNKNI